MRPKRRKRHAAEHVEPGVSRSTHAPTVARYASVLIARTGFGST
jgi:hypothetical protein